jgi:uncharacterized protein DUF6984
MSSHQVVKIDPPRLLTREEQAILIHLLSPDFPGRDELQQQVSLLRVSEECSECASITLVSHAPIPRATSVKRRIPIEAVGLDQDGTPIHFLPHVVDGLIIELEIYREDGKRLNQLPEISSLELLLLD